MKHNAVVRDIELADTTLAVGLLEPPCARPDSCILNHASKSHKLHSVQFMIDRRHSFLRVFCSHGGGVDPAAIPVEKHLDRSN